jgi:hypothetical protein
MKTGYVWGLLLTSYNTYIHYTYTDTCMYMYAGPPGGKPKKAHPKLSVQDVLSMERDADFVHAGEEGRKQVCVGCGELFKRN